MLFVLIALIPIFSVISIASDVNTTAWVQRVIFKTMGKSPDAEFEHAPFVFIEDTEHVYNFTLKGIVDKDFRDYVTADTRKFMDMDESQRTSNFFGDHEDESPYPMKPLSLSDISEQEISDISSDIPKDVAEEKSNNNDPIEQDMFEDHEDESTTEPISSNLSEQDPSDLSTDMPTDVVQSRASIDPTE